jgi:hypothetical protein
MAGAVEMAYAVEVATGETVVIAVTVTVEAAEYPR